MNPGPERRDLPYERGGPSDWIHDEELDTSESVVRELLEQHCPDLASSQLGYLENTGTSNALWRVRGRGGGDCVVRLPRTGGAEQSIAREIALLPALAATDLAEVVTLPQLIHRGEPSSAFPHHWMVVGWIEGEDAWTSRADIGRSATATTLAVDLAAAVRSIGELTGLPAPDRTPGERGGAVAPVLDRLDRWLQDPAWRADDLVDVPAVRRVSARCAEVVGGAAPRRFVHGDLIPGNLLLQRQRLSSIIDWGGAGYGDPAQDLAPAWALFDPEARAVFRAELAVDETSWLRALAFELEHAVGGVLYYGPRRHPLGDVMAATLHRILSETPVD